MAKKLFILDSNQVQGPFKVDEVQRDVLMNKWTESALIWITGTPSWVPLSNFEFSQFSDFAPEVPSADTEGKKWYIEFEGHCDGPFDTKLFLSRLNEASYLRRVRIWGSHLPAWTSPYECEEIRSVLGIEIREHQRVAFTGSAHITANGSNFEMALTTLSQGGFGGAGADSLVVGEVYPVLIQSPHLSGKIRASAKYLYASPDGFAGFQFTQIHQEPLSLIISYIKESQLKSDETVVEEKPIWFAFCDGQKVGPLSSRSVISLVGSAADKATVQLWKPGMARWAKLSDVAEIYSELEKSETRRGGRAPLIGQIIINKAGETHTFEIGTLSLTGVGLKKAKVFAVGDKVEGNMKSPLLNAEINFRGVIQHMSAAGDCGVEFESLSENDQNTIRDYLSQFFSVKIEESPLSRVA